MVKFSGPPSSAIRNRAISRELRDILEAAAEVVGIDEIRITSGRQPGTHGRSIGSTRHNGGRAADLQLIRNGVRERFTDAAGGPIFEGFVTAAAAAGAIGIGAGVQYMGDRTIHVGFGLNKNDTRRLVWGAKGRSANAPQWLRDAAEAGWNAPEPLPDGPSFDDVDLPSLFAVVARDGLNVRKGPGLEFGVSNILPTGAEVTVIAFDGPNADWARVDLEGDGLVDGHVFAAYLAPSIEAIEDADEPGEDNVV